MYSTLGKKISIIAVAFFLFAPVASVHAVDMPAPVLAPTPVLAPANPNLDSDKDGLIDNWEIKLKSDPQNPDTDGDGYKDGNEVMNGYSPTRTDETKVKKQIEVNIKKFQLQYFFDGILLDTIAVSTGARGYPTPRGNFKVIQKGI